MDSYSLLAILVIGAVCGWLAGLIVRGYGMGLLLNMVIGIVGAFLGGYLFVQLGVHVMPGLGGVMIQAVSGAVVILLALGLIRRAA